jgi:hypothetical protein
VRVVSGRANNQTPSDVAGSQAPLPFGVYKFDFPGVVEFKDGEFGGVWSSMTSTIQERDIVIRTHKPAYFIVYQALLQIKIKKAGCFNLSYIKIYFI